MGCRALCVGSRLEVWSRVEGAGCAGLFSRDVGLICRRAPGAAAVAGGLLALQQLQEGRRAPDAAPCAGGHLALQQGATAGSECWPDRVRMPRNERVVCISAGDSHSVAVDDKVCALFVDPVCVLLVDEVRVLFIDQVCV